MSARLFIFRCRVRRLTRVRRAMSPAAVLRVRRNLSTIPSYGGLS